MMRARKKVIDKPSEAVIAQAAKTGIPLPFDRYEDQVPACGFGRMGLDCKACTQGPCRINPFEDTRGTACGRDREGTVASNFLRLISDGAVASATLAGAESSIAPVVFSGITAANEGGDAAVLLSKAIEVASTAYAALPKANGSAIVEFEVGMGVLNPDRLNILLVGSIPALQAQKIAAALSTYPRVNVVAASGAEATGLPVAGNYNSEEALLVTTAVDGVVTGKNCVAPGFTALAAQQKVMAMSADAFDAAKLIRAAEAHFRANSGRSLGARHAPARAISGFASPTFNGIDEDRWKELAGMGVKGVAVIGGCNNVVETQDGAVVRQAIEFLKSDAIVIASGCAATALAKAGYMAPNSAAAAGDKLRGFLAALSESIGSEIPAVLGTGSCWQISTAVEMAQLLGGRLNVPVVLSMPEISRPASWSTALAVASQGIPTYVGPILPLDGGLGTVATLNAMLAASDGSLKGPGQAGAPEAFAASVMSYS